VLILDEPTAGLDPNQTRAFQGVIRSLAGSRTILMATHSLAEADALGHRILILHRGRLAAWDTPAALRRGAAGTMRVTAEVRAPFETVRRTCDTLLFADRVDLEPVGEWVRLRLSARGDADLRTDLYQLAVREGWGLRELHIDLPTLEAVFARITGEEGDHG